jgi:hypothetical protein
MEEKTRQIEQRESYAVLILTPYLTERLEEFATPSELEIQRERYAYNPDNFSGARSLKTNSGREVFLQSPMYNGFRRSRADISAQSNLDLIIHGSTVPSEEEVEELKPSGIVVARYSIFYGDVSEYSGRTPQEGGYSIDIPKDVEVVRNLLSDDSFLESIVCRNPQRVVDSIDQLNQRISTPVLITPFLKEALLVGRETERGK